jgi:hypothetical protein
MREHSNAAARGIPTPAPIAISFVEQLGQEEGETPALLDWLPISVPPPPAVVEDAPLEDSVVVIEAVAVVETVVVVDIIFVDVNTPVSSVITQIDGTVFCVITEVGTEVTV